MPSTAATHLPPSPLFAALTLPNGAILPNRIAKAAMEENLADARQAPGPQLQRLYARWAAGGAGLLLSGNVMVDARAVTGPGAVVLDDASTLDSFKAWAKAGRAHGAQFWLQISHPGRQVYKAMGQETLSPSDIALDLPGFSNMFGQPRAMNEIDIADVVQRFARTAALAEEAGFSGVQIHAAHGYLLSQFLSPNTNHRKDAWGGSLENRARLLLDVVRAVRAVVKPGFCVAVKLNSADFQRGGFDADDAQAVVDMLGELAVDLVELSGGSYESPAMQGNTRDGRTLEREAYFLDFARDIARTARMPLMLTGGVLRRAVAERVLADGIAVVGIARGLALVPDLPQQWRAGAIDVALPLVNWKNKTFAGLATMAIAKAQLRRMAAGRAPNLGMSPLLTLVGDQLRQRVRTRQYRHWLAARSAT